MLVICLHCNEEFDLERWAESPKIADVAHCEGYRVAAAGATASEAQRIRIKRLEGFVGCTPTPLNGLKFGPARRRINELERQLIERDRAAS
jgi:hypothetical protein